MNARRSDYEIIIQPGVRPQRRRRIAVTALFAPTAEAAAQLLLEQPPFQGLLTPDETVG